MSRRKCCICSNKNPPLHLVKTEWIETIRKLTNVEAKKSSIICCNHFEEKSCCNLGRRSGEKFKLEFCTSYYTSPSKRVKVDSERPTLEHDTHLSIFDKAYKE